MIENIFRKRFVRLRMARGHLGIILYDFVLDLEARGYAFHSVQAYGQTAEHFSRWLGMRALPPRNIDEALITRFLSRHLPHCRCPVPAPVHPGNGRAALGCLLRFLRQCGIVRPPAARHPSAAQRLETEYDTHLAELSGLSAATRSYRRRYAREFMAHCGSSRLGWHKLSPTVVANYVQALAPARKPSSMRVLAVSLRSFLRFWAVTGRIRNHLTQAVPQPAPWPASPPPQTLSDPQLHVFLQSFDRHTATGRRDFAMGLLMARLGLRTHEVAGLMLEDVDWRQSTLRLRRTKQRRERLLPLAPAVRRAIAAYLRRGRPTTPARALFVRHHLPYGSPLMVHPVRGAMRRAFARSGIVSGKVHLLRHTLATRLHSRRVGLKAIADLLGHQSLDPTARYARVDIEQLRQAALPWP
jgi:site-specific recombinase XerD